MHGDLRRLRRARPPALVLGGLNLLRPLGLAGIPAIVASSDPRAPAFRSRYCSARCLLPPLEHREAALKVLLEAGDRLVDALGQPLLLVYGNDDTLELVQEYRSELSARFRLLLNDPEIAHALIAKDRFAALARSRGLPVPRSLAWDGEGDESLAAHEGPVLVKPKSKVAWEDSPVLMKLLGGDGKALVFENARQVFDNPLAQQLRHKLCFQPYIPGDDRSLWSFHGFADERGTLLGWFIGRKIRTHPPLTGESTYLELARHERLAALGQDIVARLPLKGVFKMDFKQDARTGEFRVLEINARYNLWHYMGAVNGVNLPAIAYDYLVNGQRPAHSPPYRTRTRWLHLRSDFHAFRQLSSLSTARWLASIVFHRKVYDLLSWTDPAPLLTQARDRLFSRLQRLLAQLRWPSTAS